MKNAFDRYIPKVSHEEFTDLIVYKEPLYKKKILDYLTSEKHTIGYTTEPVYDRLNGEKVYGFWETEDEVMTDDLYNDGIYTWHGSDIYCLSKYNIMPSDEFVRYVLDKAGDENGTDT